jgi:hypothetical protein
MIADRVAVIPQQQLATKKDRYFQAPEAND